SGPDSPASFEVTARSPLTEPARTKCPLSREPHGCGGSRDFDCRFVPEQARSVSTSYQSFDRRPPQAFAVVENAFKSRKTAVAGAGLCGSRLVTSASISTSVGWG